MIIGDTRSKTADVATSHTTTGKQSVSEKKLELEDNDTVSFLEEQKYLKIKNDMQGNLNRAAQMFLCMPKSFCFEEVHMKRVFSSWYGAVKEAACLDRKSAKKKVEENALFVKSLPKKLGGSFLVNFGNNSAQLVDRTEKHLARLPQVIVHAMSRGYFSNKMPCQDALLSSILYEALVGSLFFVHDTYSYVQKNRTLDATSGWMSFLNTLSNLLVPEGKKHYFGTEQKLQKFMVEHASSSGKSSNPFVDADVRIPFTSMDENQEKQSHCDEDCRQDVEDIVMRQSILAQQEGFSSLSRYRVRQRQNTELLNRHLGNSQVHCRLEKEIKEVGESILSLLLFGGILAGQNLVFNQNALDCSPDLETKGLHPLLHCPLFGGRASGTTVESSKKPSTCVVVVRGGNGMVSTSLFGSFDKMAKIMQERGNEKASEYRRSTQEHHVYLEKKRTFTKKEFKRLEKAIRKQDVAYAIKEGKNPTYLFPVVKNMKDLLLRAVDPSRKESRNSFKFLGWTEATPLRSLYLSIFLTSAMETSLVHFFLCQSSPTKKKRYITTAWDPLHGVHTVTVNEANFKKVSKQNIFGFCTDCAGVSTACLGNSISRTLYHNLASQSTGASEATSTKIRSLFFKQQATSGSKLFANKLECPLRIPSGNVKTPCVQISSNSKHGVRVPLVAGDVFAHCLENGVLDPVVQGGNLDARLVLVPKNDQTAAASLQATAYLHIQTPIPVTSSKNNVHVAYTTRLCKSSTAKQKTKQLPQPAPLDGYLKIFSSQPHTHEPTQIFFLEEDEEGAIMYKKKILFHPPHTVDSPHHVS